MFLEQCHRGLVNRLRLRREIEEARTLYRRCESADNDGAGIMFVDGNLPGPVVG